MKKKVDVGPQVRELLVLLKDESMTHALTVLLSAATLLAKEMRVSGGKFTEVAEYIYNETELRQGYMN